MPYLLAAAMTRLTQRQTARFGSLAALLLTWISCSPPPESQHTIADAQDASQETSKKMASSQKASKMLSALSVIINEIHYHPPHAADAKEEFLELHNRSHVAIDLQGWKLTSGVKFRFDSSSGPTIIPAKGYLLVAKSPADLARITRLDATAIAGPYEGKLSNFKDRVALQNAQGVEIDRMEYSQDGLWPARADGLGASLQRVSSEDSGSLPQNWKVSSGNWPEDSQRIVITNGAKVRWYENQRGRDPNFATARPWFHPDFDDTDVANRFRDGRLAVGYDTSDRERQGWIRTDATARRGLHSILLRIPFESPRDVSNNELICLDMDWDDGFVAWLNGVEIARRGMKTPPGTVPAMNGLYEAEIVEALGDKQNEPGYQRIWLAHSSVLNRGRNILAIGNYNASSRSSDLFATVRMLLVPGGAYADFTPGAENNVIARRAPPLVSFFERTPEEPRPGDSVKIEAKVDGGDVKDVRLYYDMGAGKESILLLDDGRQRDVTARDGIYSGEVPPAPDLTLVRFRIEARDTAGGLTTYPREGNPSSYAGYYVVDRRRVGNEDLDVYHLLWSGSLSCSRKKWRKNATLVHRGTAYVDVRIKYRGDTSCGEPKSGLRVAFNKGELFQGQRRLNFLACWQDRSLMREVLGWDLYRDIGHSHCTARMAAIYTSGNQFGGLYVSLEVPSEAYLRRNGHDSDEALWKCRNALRDGSIDAYEKLTAKNNRAHWDDLAQFGSKLGSLEGKKLIDFVLEKVDVERLIEYQTVKCLISDEDGYTKNWLLFRGSSGDGGSDRTRWSPQPWDLDLSFGQTHLGDDRIFTEKHPLMGTREHLRSGRDWNGLIDAAFGPRASDYFVKALYGRIRGMLEEKFNPRVLGKKIDRIDRNTIQAASMDLTRWPRWGNEPADPAYHRQRLRKYVDARWNFLQRFLEGEQTTSHKMTPRFRSAGTRRRFQYKPAPRMKITEIHYAPQRGVELEFIEIRNLESVAVDISGWNMPAINYTFPAGSKASANSYFVVARRPDQFNSVRQVRKDLEIFGPYQGKLSNGGEDLRLRDSGKFEGKMYFPETIDVVKYDVESPWPEISKIGGRSLELRDLAHDNDYGSSWQPSRVRGGSPGSLSRTN